MSDDNDNVSKLVILVLGIAAIGFFAYLIFKESMKYQVGGQQQATMSLADDNYFQMDRRLHQLEIDRTIRGNVRNVRTLQPVQKVEQMESVQSTEYVQTPDAPPIPRKVVSMNSKQVQEPNIHNLSKADQDKIRRLFFNML